MLPITTPKPASNITIEWLELTQAVFGTSRSMTIEERDALDKFTWEELQASVLTEE